MPILVVDSLFLTGVYRTEMSSKEHLMENEANAINYTFANQVDQAAKLGNALYSSQYIQNFVKRRYNTNLEYFNAYQSLMENTQLKLVEGQSGLNFSIYVDNITITNGGKDLNPKAKEVFDKIENGETDINKTIFLSYTFGTVAFKLPAIEKQYMNLFGPYEIK